MSTDWTAGSNKNQGNVKIQSFLEALRASQSTQAKTSETAPGKNIFAELQAKKEVEKHRIEQFQQHRSQEWNKVFSAKEADSQRKIESIRLQLSQLSKQLKRLDINIIKAVESPVVETGVYQETYLEHLRNIIHVFGLKVNRANSWLEVYQNRSKKQGMYWGMAKSKGNSFTQNDERNIATSVG